MKLNIFRSLVLTVVTVISLFSPNHVSKTYADNTIQVAPDPSLNNSYPLQGFYFSPDINSYTFVWWNAIRYTWCDIRGNSNYVEKVINGSPFPYNNNMNKSDLEANGASYWSIPCKPSLWGIRHHHKKTRPPHN